MAVMAAVQLQLEERFTDFAGLEPELTELVPCGRFDQVSRGQIVILAVNTGTAHASGFQAPDAKHAPSALVVVEARIEFACGAAPPNGNSQHQVDTIELTHYAVLAARGERRPRASSLLRLRVFHCLSE